VVTLLLIVTVTKMDAITLAGGTDHKGKLQETCTSVTNGFLVPVTDDVCLSSTGKIIIDRVKLKCLERILYQCHFMPHTSRVEDNEAKHE
jgi:hypothetical protein